MITFRKFLQNENTQFLTDAEVAGVYMHHRDKSVLEIARETGRSVPEVYRILRRFSLEPNRNQRYDQNHLAVLNYSNTGMNVAEIALVTGYTPRNVRYILSKFLTEG